jgi:GTP:adenosylcobinamide-phosphate guanylyltransferase/predicted transcriptional regulator
MPAVKNFEKVLLIQHSDIHAAIEKLDNNEAHIVLVIDKNRKLLGTVTDGDVRRGILRGVSLGESITSIMNDNPIFANQNQTKNVIYSIMRKNQIRQIPIVNDSHEVCGLEILDNFSDFNKKNNIVILMAGGLSTRLRPLTNDCPKPMLKVGGKPILETILLSLIESGFHLFYISINYLGEQIKEYFGNGEKWGVSIRYIQEDNKMGTAGALSLIPDVHKDPIIVMNSDLLTTVDFNQLISFHLEQQSTATMCVREFSHTVPYGICTLDNNYIIDILLMLGSTY